MRSLFVLLAAFLVSHGFATDPIVLKPVKAGNPAALIMIQGAQIPASAYVPLMKELQLRSSLSLYISIPTFLLNTPEPLVLESGITAAQNTLFKAGLDKDAPIFMAGHSLGGAMLQDYVFKCTNCQAQILMGAGLLRKYRDAPYPVNTLTIDGTLDGLYRVTRQAENYYHSILHADASNVGSFPVVVYEGVNHMQFASGEPPYLVKRSDLKAEVSNEAAHNFTAATIASFLDVQAPSVSQDLKSAGLASLSAEVSSTGTIVAPLIAALEQEGFAYFKKPCNSDYPMPSCPTYPRYPGKQRGDQPQTDCLCGTPWTQNVAQIVMGGLQEAGVQVDVTDSIHSVADVNPIHLPHIWSDPCPPGQESSCTINVTTVTEQVYEKLDSFDTGFSSTSASELRVKMKSRQTLWMAAGRKDVNFTQTDEVPNTCADINKLALEWALKRAGSAALERFVRLGEPLQFGDDLGPYNAGPLWIYDGLKYNDATDKSVMTVQSPMMHTPVDYSISAAAGFHYCKLLSPARAMEWIYIDGLRAKAGIGS